MGYDSLSRIQILENDLADALEANHLYKLQLKRLDIMKDTNFFI